MSKHELVCTKHASRTRYYFTSFEHEEIQQRPEENPIENFDFSKFAAETNSTVYYDTMLYRIVYTVFMVVVYYYRVHIRNKLTIYNVRNLYATRTKCSDAVTARRSSRSTLPRRIVFFFYYSRLRLDNNNCPSVYLHTATTIYYIV